MGVIIHGVSRRRARGPREIFTDVDIRDKAIIWLVYRRESRGPKKRGVYHYMGCAAATGEKSAEEIAVDMCDDETYFIFSSIVNAALPVGPVFPRDLYFPKRKPLTDPDEDTIETGWAALPDPA